FGFRMADDSAKAGDYRFDFTNGARMPELWADDGLPIPVQNNLYKVYDRDSDPKDPDAKVLGRYVVTEPAISRIPRNRMWYQHRRAHRSSFTHASQFALHLEQASDKSSVTFINLAMSGATVDHGLVGNFTGSENDYVYVTPSVLRGQPTKLPAQFTTLRQILGTRAIDDVYLSVGGNDAGFANIIAGFMTAWTHLSNDSQQLLAATVTGDWRFLAGELGADLVFSRALGDDAKKLPGLSGLHDAYDKVQREFMSLRTAGQFTGDVHMILPPFFGTAHRDARTNDNPHLGGLSSSNVAETFYCKADIDKADLISRLVSGMDPSEFRYVRQNIYPLLVEAMRSYRHTDDGVPQWKFIHPARQGYDGQPAANGMCGIAQGTGPNYAPKHGPELLGSHLENAKGERWYRSPQEAAGIQTGHIANNMGMFHPTERGYAWMAWRLMEERAPFDIEYPEASFTDPDDTFAEAPFVRLPVTRQVVLQGPQDVSVVRVFLSKGQILSVRETARTGTNLAFTVFDASGMARASTLKDRGPVAAPHLATGLLASDGIVASTTVTGSSSALVSALEQSGSLQPIGGTPSQQGSPLPPLLNVSPELRPDDFDQNVQAFRFRAPESGTYALAISDVSNDHFDVLTGTGDVFSPTGQATRATIAASIGR
ncbi:MAG: hypothetical protein AAFX00_04520, partial [Pseudomonadota bacterium]